MVWTSPMTAVDGNIFTAAEFNLNVRDNLNYLKTELDNNPKALATVAGQYPVSTGSGALAMRQAQTSEALSQVQTTSTFYTALGSGTPSVSLTTGTTALVLFGCNLWNTEATRQAIASVSVSGATSIPASDEWRICNEQDSGNHVLGLTQHKLFTGLTPGTNTFRMEYKTESNPSPPPTPEANFIWRRITVVPF